MVRTAVRTAVCLLLSLTLLAPAGPAAAISTDPVPQGLRTGRVLVLRPGRIDVVRDGSVRRFVFVGRRVALSDLPRLISDPEYVVRSRPGVIRLAATIAQRPGTVLISGGAQARRLELDETGGVPVQLLGTRATLRLQGTTIAIAGATRTRNPIVGALRYVNGSSVDLSNLAVTGLGDPGGRAPAIEVSSGSSVSLRSVRITGGGPGLHLMDVARAGLTGVSVLGTGGTGVQVSGGGAIAVRGLTVSRSSGDGVRIQGPVTALGVTDVVAADNRGAGVTLLTQRGGTLARLRTTHNLGDGLSLKAVSGLRAEGLDSAWDARALTVEGGSDTSVGRVASQGGAVLVNGSTRLRLDRVRVRWVPEAAMKISGNRIAITDADVAETGEGVVVGAGAVGVTARRVTASGVTVTGGTFSGRRAAVRVTGSAVDTSLGFVTASAPQGVALQVSGPGTRVRAGLWSGAAGIRVRDQATGVVVDGACVSSSGSALEVPSDGVGTVQVTGATLTGGGRKTVSSAARNLTLRWTLVSGAALGVDLRGDGTVVDSTIAGTRQALRVRTGHTGTVQRGRFQAADLGLEVAPGAALTVQDSVVRASLASRGQASFTGRNDLSPRPLRGLALAAAGMIAAALGLEVLRRLREPAAGRRVDAPAHVLNRW